MVNLCMCLSFNFAYQIKLKTDQCSVIPTTLLGCLPWKGESFSFLIRWSSVWKEWLSVSFKGPKRLSCWQRFVHLCHQATSNGYFLRIGSMFSFSINHSSDIRYKMACVNCVSFKGPKRLSCWEGLQCPRHQANPFG